jgi:hypothetical protein
MLSTLTIHLFLLPYDGAEHQLERQHIEASALHHGDKGWHRYIVIVERTLVENGYPLVS